MNKLQTEVEFVSYYFPHTSQNYAKPLCYKNVALKKIPYITH